MHVCMRVSVCEHVSVRSVCRMRVSLCTCVCARVCLRRNTTVTNKKRKENTGATQKSEQRSETSRNGSFICHKLLGSLSFPHDVNTGENAPA